VYFQDVFNKKVILLHGIWTNGWVLYPLRQRLEKAGLDPVIFNYPSISRSFQENVNNLALFIEQIGVKKILLVGHSYGGLIACGLVNATAQGLIDLDIEIERCVFIGSPVQGSCVARHLSNLFIVQILTGKSLPVLKKGCAISSGMVQTAMVAGDLNLGLGMFFMSGPGDGMVALKDTMAPWLDKHFVVHASHLGLLLSKKVAKICAEFLL